MPVVKVLPSDIDIKAEFGEHLMAAARRTGVRWPSVCQGVAQCGICYIEILASDAAPTAPCREEASMLLRSSAKAKFGGVLRLACQLPVTSDLVVQRVGIRPPSPGPLETDETITTRPHSAHRTS